MSPAFVFALVLASLYGLMFYAVVGHGWGQLVLYWLVSVLGFFSGTRDCALGWFGNFEYRRGECGRRNVGKLAGFVRLAHLATPVKGCISVLGQIGYGQMNLRLPRPQVAVGRLGGNRRRSVSRCCCSELIRPAKLAPKVKCTPGKIIHCTAFQIVL
jgi:hypothetical protein